MITEDKDTLASIGKLVLIGIAVTLALIVVATVLG
jgi:hypothetical protein